MQETNHQIREACRDSGVLLWQVAERLGIADSSFSRMLRHELPKEKRDEICSIISELSKEAQETWQE